MVNKNEWLEGFLDIVPEELQEKWIKKAIPKSHAGKFGAWCKSQGFKGVCQECINKAAQKGGNPAKMALFAVNVSKGKYHWPKKK